MRIKRFTNPVVLGQYGRNALRGWLRSHPEVARRHWADVVAGSIRRNMT